MSGHDRARIGSLVSMSRTIPSIGRVGSTGTVQRGAEVRGEDQPVGARFTTLTRDRPPPRDDPEPLVRHLRTDDLEQRHHVAAEPFDPKSAVGIGHDPTREKQIAFDAHAFGEWELVRPAPGVRRAPGLGVRHPDVKDPHLRTGDGASLEIDEPAVDRLVTGGKADRLVLQVIAQAKTGRGGDDVHSACMSPGRRFHFPRSKRHLEPAVGVGGLPDVLVSPHSVRIRL